ncbi:hypothetical protein HY333_01850 [Candidatus Collierbacteria bacterium]|nr:hypothetical protein [Candidatus Collierbacteria bacterium]
MEMPVTVGVILAVMFLITFTGWFYNLVQGLRELLIDDMFFFYRVAGASVISILIFVASFMGIATIRECRSEEREGFFKALKCEEYLRIKSAAEEAFQPLQK